MITIREIFTVGVLSFVAWQLDVGLSPLSIAARGQENAANHASHKLTIAKNDKSNGKQKGVREKNILREKTVRSDQKKVDFDAVDISGERKTPFGSIINQNKANKEYDLIRPRLRWHDEMKQSTSSLETGRAAGT